MDRERLSQLKAEFHTALKEHELAAREFLSCPDDVRGAKMSMTYDQAAELRKILKNALECKRVNLFS